MKPNGLTVMIYGDDTAAMKEIARQLRIDGHTVGLRTLNRYQGDTENCNHVIMLAEHDGVAAAYDARGIPVELLTDGPEPNAGNATDDAPADTADPVIHDNAADAQADAPAPATKPASKGGKGNKKAAK